MSEIVKWSGAGGISFFAKPTEIRGVKDLNITAAVETEDSTKDGEKFVKKKNKGSYTIQLTAVLDAALNVDVQKVETQIMEAARCGDTGYLYTGGSKLFPCTLMATEAKTQSIRLSPTGKMNYCEIAWTLKQCSKYGGSSSSSSSGSGSGGGKKQIPKNVVDKVKQTATTVMTTVAGAIVSWVTGATNTTNAAKTQSAKVLADANKKTTTATKVASGGKFTRVNTVK